MSPRNIHGTVVRVAETGILITGPARSGKSALALSLIRAAKREGLAATLIGDDQLFLSREGGHLYAHCPAPILGLIEISGVGLLRLPAEPRARVDWLVALEDHAPRLPQSRTTRLQDIELPRLALPPGQAAYAADVVLTVLEAGHGAFLEL